MQKRFGNGWSYKKKADNVRLFLFRKTKLISGIHADPLAIQFEALEFHRAMGKGE